MPIASVANLVEELRELGLLSPEQVEALSCTADAGELKALARDLIRRGWLTAFQISQVIQGHGRELFLGPYLFLERLGEGGMGQVFKARQRNLDRIEAVKVIRKDRLSNPNTLRRFQREVCATTRLDHPNIVRALDAGLVGDTWYFAMEYVPGTDLAHRLRASGPLPIAEACDYIRQAALALQHAHEKGLVHRDLKPHNLIVVPPPAGSPFGLLKVLDMGLALVTYSEEQDSLTALTQHGFVMGTADYMAPEQAQNAHAVDIRADLYSLGCTLYHLVAGEVPFPGGTLLEKLMKHRLEEALPIEALRPDLPPGVAAAVRRLMARSPADRVQTPAELVALLSDNRTYLDEQPGQPKLGATLVMQRPIEVAPFQPRKPKSRTPTASATVNELPPVEVEPLPSRERRQQRRLAPRRRSSRWPLIALAVVGVVGVVALLSVMGALRGRGDLTTASGNPPVDPVAEARKAWQALQPLQGDDLRNALLAFHANHPKAQQHAEALAWLARLPSPLDTLDGGRDPAVLAIPNRPPDLVRVLRPPRGQPDDRLAFRPDGRELATGHDGEVIVWDVMRGVPARKHPFPGGKVKRLAWSANGRSLAAGGSEGKMQLWTDGEPGRPFGTDSHGILALAFSPDGRTLATGDDHGKVCLWDIRNTARPIIVLFDNREAARLLSLAWSPDGRCLVAGSADNKLRAWRAADHTPLWTNDSHSAWVFAAAFTPDGGSLISGGGGNGALSVSRWSEAGLKEGRPLRGEGGVVLGMTASPDGRAVCTADEHGALVLRSLAKDEVVRCWHFSGKLHDLSAPCDGRHVAVPLESGLIYIIRLPPRP
jgi:serine/threonine-protein kinase